MKNPWLTRPLLLATLLACTPAVQAEPAAPLLPAEYFAEDRGFDDASLSPNGEKIAYMIRLRNQETLVVQSLDGSNRIAIPPVGKSEIWSFRWANDQVLLIQFSLTVNRLEFASRVHETRTVSFNLDTRDFKWLGKPKQSRNTEFASQHERVVDLLPDDPDHILMELDFELDGAPAVYRVDINNLSRSQAKSSRSYVQDWYTDQNSEVRLGMGYDKKQRRITLKNAAGEWLDLDKTDWADRYDFEAFTADNDMIYVTGHSAFGTTGLYKLSLTSGKIVETVHADPKADIEGIVKHPATGRFAGVYLRDRIIYKDPDLDLLQRSLEAALPGNIISIVGKAREKDWYLVLARNDREAGNYFFYNRPERNLSFIASRRAKLEARHMATTRAVDIPARDGTLIPAYLTLPAGVDDAKGLPAIVMPHGGPIGVRDDADFDWWAQFMANRGYAVLKPNYRGSGGYGGAYQAAGIKQWGGLMQDDITDATRWLISEGIADPAHVCIVGASFGGYAALMGPIREPGLYRCAASINGVTDIAALRVYDRGFVGGRIWTKTMGLEGHEDKEVSPTDRAEEIDVPVLLIAANDDTVVPVKQSRAMDKKLRKLKKPSRYVELKDGAHWMQTQQARLTMLTELDKFLAQHLGQQ